MRRKCTRNSERGKNVQKRRQQRPQPKKQQLRRRKERPQKRQQLIRRQLSRPPLRNVPRRRDRRRRGSLKFRKCNNNNSKRQRGGVLSASRGCPMDLRGACRRRSSENPSIRLRDSVVVRRHSRLIRRSNM